MAATVMPVLGMIGTILTVVLGVAAVAVYFAAVRQDKPWGQPVLVLCVLGAVIAVVVEQTGLFEGVGRSHEPHKNVRKLGEGLKGQVSDGAKVLIITGGMGMDPMMDPAMMPPEGEMPEGERPEGAPTREEMIKEAEESKRQMQEQIQKALEKGLGCSVEVVAFEYPSMEDAMMVAPGPEGGGNADVFNDMLKEHEGKNLDAIVSMLGLPVDMQRGLTWELDRLVCYEWSKKPKFGAALGMFYDPQVVKEYIEEGLLQAAVIQVLVGEGKKQRAEWRVITKETLDQLPTEVPESMKAYNEGVR